MGPHSAKLPQSWDTGSEQPSAPAVVFHFLEWEEVHPKNLHAKYFDFLTSTLFDRLPVWFSQFGVRISVLSELSFRTELEHDERF